MAKTTVRHKVFGADHGLIHEAVVTGRKVGADEEFWGALAHNEALFRRVVSLVRGDEIAGLAATSCTPAEAARIMGGNFHGPGEAAKHFGLKRLGCQKAFLSVPFSSAVLQECKDSHVLVAIAPLSIMAVQTKMAHHFYWQTNPWYGDSRQAFAHDKAQAGWHLVRKDEVPGSTSKRWADQQVLLSADEYVPTAAVLVQATMLHYLGTSERLFSQVWVRTASVTADGVRVVVLFGSGGLRVSGWGSSADVYFGVASARKS